MRVVQPSATISPAQANFSITHSFILFHVFKTNVVTLHLPSSSVPLAIPQSQRETNHSLMVLYMPMTLSFIVNTISLIGSQYLIARPPTIAANTPMMRVFHVRNFLIQAPIALKALPNGPPLSGFGTAPPPSPPSKDVSVATEESGPSPCFTSSWIPLFIFSSCGFFSLLPPTNEPKSIAPLAIILPIVLRGPGIADTIPFNGANSPSLSSLPKSLH